MNTVTQSSPNELCFCREHQEGKRMTKSVVTVDSVAGQTVPKTVNHTFQFDAAITEHKLAMSLGFSQV